VVSKFLTLLTYLLDIDNIDELVTELHEEIHKSGRNKIIFIHCAAGMDRTGYVSGAYKLKYLNYSLEQVLQENSKFGGARKYMHINTYYGLKWFCFNHKDKE
jgi:protein tyrosine/serine phosphatase